jgi:hypothetical protein
MGKHLHKSLTLDVPLRRDDASARARANQKSVIEKQSSRHFNQCAEISLARHYHYI